MDETQISNSEPAYLRYKGAWHIYEKFIESCGPYDSYFQMITFLDAFLFLYVSIEEMINKQKKHTLNQLDVYNFLKAARNITTHHSILAAPKQKGDFERPFSRCIEEGGIPSAKLKMRIEKFRQIFSLAAKNYKRGEKQFLKSEDYLNRIEAEGKNEIYIEEIMLEGLIKAAKVLDFKGFGAKSAHDSYSAM